MARTCYALLQSRNRPKVVVFFDVNMPRAYFEQYRELFSSLGIEIVFFGGENLVDPPIDPKTKKLAKKPFQMSDTELVQYAEKLLGRRYRRWRRDIKAYLFTVDRRFITPIEIRRVSQPNSPDFKQKALIRIVQEIEPEIPGITANIRNKIEESRS